VTGNQEVRRGWSPSAQSPLLRVGKGAARGWGSWDRDTATVFFKGPIQISPLILNFPLQKKNGILRTISMAMSVCLL